MLLWLFIGKESYSYIIIPVVVGTITAAILGAAFFFILKKYRWVKAPWCLARKTFEVQIDFFFLAPKGDVFQNSKIRTAGKKRKLEQQNYKWPAHKTYFNLNVITINVSVPCSLWNRMSRLSNRWGKAFFFNPFFAYSEIIGFVMNWPCVIFRIRSVRPGPSCSEQR